MTQREREALQRLVDTVAGQVKRPIEPPEDNDESDNQARDVGSGRYHRTGERPANP